MSETNGRFRVFAAELALATLALTACGSSEDTSGGTSTYEATTSDPIASMAEEGMRQINCAVRNVPTEDCDGDTVMNARDAYQGRDDLADDDSDFVINALDKHPGFRDTQFDIDSDGTPDYLDTFFGDNFADADGDGLPNGIDLQPYSAPPQPVAAPEGVTAEQLTHQILNIQVRRKVSAQYFAHDTDTDLDGIPDVNDSTPNEYTNDRDGDGDPDYYDPKPGDYSIDSRNDPLDPRNNEYYNEDDFGYNDPYDGKD